MKLECDVIRDLLPLSRRKACQPRQQCAGGAAPCRVRSLPCRAGTDGKAGAGAAGAPAGCTAAEHPKDLTEKEHPHSGGSGSGSAVRFWAGVLDGRRKTPVTAEQAKIWTYNKKENEANLCVLEVQGENVRLELEGSFNWGKPSVTVRAVRYTFPHIHAALEGLLGTSASDTSIAVSGTQLLTVQCADETRYYRDGQQVERFILKKEDGTQTYVYESEDVVTQEQGVFEKG